MDVSDGVVEIRPWGRWSPVTVMTGLRAVVFCG